MRQLKVPVSSIQCTLDIGMPGHTFWSCLLLMHDVAVALSMTFSVLPAGSKSMQDGWGENDGSVAASRHSSWEEEEEGGGMWNSTGSQGSGSSWGQGSNGGWGQGHAGKKPNNKVGCFGKIKLNCLLMSILLISLVSGLPLKEKYKNK